MRVRFFTLLLLILAVATSCKSSEEKNCYISVANAKADGKVVDVSIKTNCVGLFVKLTKRYAFYVNLSNSVKNGAVPYGFSAVDFKEKRYISLGVDGNIREVDINGFILDERSKILDKHGAFLINFKIHTPYPLSKLMVEFNGKTRQIKFDRSLECKDAFLMLLEKPDAFNKKPVSYAIPKLSDFMDVCMTQKSHAEKDKNLVSIFRVDEKFLLKLENSGKNGLAEFLRRKFLKNKQTDILDKCHVKLIVLNPDFEPVNGKITLIIQKITKETFERRLKNTSFDINSKGVYQAKVFYGRSYGVSSPFMCKGKYLFVVVVLKPSI